MNIKLLNNVSGKKSELNKFRVLNGLEYHIGYCFQQREAFAYPATGPESFWEAHRMTKNFGTIFSNFNENS